MNPKIWRTREKIPSELVDMLNEIYAIDLVLARSFCEKYIYDDETMGFWNRNTQYSIDSFYNGISHSAFPKHVIEKAEKVAVFCDSFAQETDDEEKKKDIEVCGNMSRMMIHTIMNSWIVYFPVNAFGNKENKSYFTISSWSSYDWSKCPAYVFAEWINGRWRTSLSDAARCKGLFMDTLDRCIQCFFPEYYPDKNIQILFAYNATPGEGRYGLHYIVYEDIKSVMKIKKGKENYVKGYLKYIDFSNKEQPLAYVDNKEGRVPVISSYSLCNLIQSGYIS